MPGAGITRTNMPTNTRDIAEEAWQMLNEIVDWITEIDADFEAHTHNADGAQAGSYFTSPPRTDAATVTLGTARTIAAAIPVKMQV